MKHAEEAAMIVSALFDELGTGGHCPRGCPFVDGREAILEMMEKKWQSWKEVEWPGFYLKHKLRELVIKKFGEPFEPINLGKLYLLKGEHIWDTRFNALGPYSGYVPFMSTENLDKIIEEYGGLGLLVINAIANADLDDQFYAWLLEKKGVSDYEIKRKADGRPPRKRKTAFMITRVYSFFFPEDSIHKGSQDGWIDPSFQEAYRQPSGEPRQAKYKLYLENIPLYHRLDVRNFNEDPDEWAEEFLR